MKCLLSISLLLLTATGLAAGELDYKSLPEYSRKVLDDVLARASGAKEGKDFDIKTLLTDSGGTRHLTRMAEGMLYRNAPGDLERAESILRWLPASQHTDRDDPNGYYGTWRSTPGQYKSDLNWREFIGCDLIAIDACFSKRLDAKLVEGIRAALGRAAEGAMKRNVSATYTNIAIMSAVLMEYVGAGQNRGKLAQAGRDKAVAIYKLFKKHNTFSEYNSPTYYGVNMVGLATWRRFGPSSKTREMGRELEGALWREIALFYNPSMKCMAGPYFRAYNMDMMRCNTITGMWIALALNDSDFAPLPMRSGSSFFEVSNAAPALLLGVNAPKDVLPKLRKFDTPRHIQRKVYNRYGGDRVKHVSTMVTQDWMMGGVVGHRRKWEQIVTGAIHWQRGDSKRPGWLVAPGVLGVDVKVTQKRMEISAGGLKTGALVLIVNAEGMTEADFGAARWDLPGLTLKVESNIGKAVVSRIKGSDIHAYCRNGDRVSEVFKVSFPLPKDVPRGILLSLTPLGKYSR